MYQVIIDPLTGQRVSAEFPTFDSAIDFAKKAIRDQGFKGVRVFHKSGKLVAQAYREKR